MLSKTSWFNRGIWVQNVKSTGWIAIVYFLALFFALPIQILMGSTRDPEIHYHPIFNASSLFGVTDGFQLTLMFTIPVLLGIFLYRYMQVKLSADYMFGLPMKRKVMFHQQFVFGIIILFVPLFLIAIILLIFSSFITVNELLLFSEIMRWFLTTFLITLLVYVATVFVGMFTGMSVMQGVLTYILLFFPAGITVLFFMNLKYYLYGFSMDYYLNYNIEKIIPFARATQLGHSPLNTIEVFSYIGVIIFLYIISVFAYERRAVEAATQAITFKGMRPVFLYGVTFCTMLVGGLYFGFDQTQGSMGWMIFGYVVASILGYYIALMLLEKSWRVLHRLKGYLIFAASMLLVFMVVNFDVLGYEKKVPALSDVEQIYFGDNSYYYYNDHFHHNGHQPNYYFTEEENMKNIIALHEKIVEVGKPAAPNSRYYRNTVIVYELKNGKKIAREYPHVNLVDFDEFHKPIVESMEYRKNMNPLLQAKNQDNLQEILFQVHSLTGKSVSISDRDQVAELLEIVIEEIMNETYEQTIQETDAWSSMSFYYREGQTISVPFKKSYTQVEAWLVENNKFDQARISSADISHIQVMKNEDNLFLYEFYKFADELQREGREEGEFIKITDGEQIEECLRNTVYQERGDYIVIIYSKAHSNNYEIKTFTKDNVPSFIEEKF